MNENFQIHCKSSCADSVCTQGPTINPTFISGIMIMPLAVEKHKGNETKCTWRSL